MPMQSLVVLPVSVWRVRYPHDGLRGGSLAGRAPLVSVAVGATRTTAFAAVHSPAGRCWSRSAIDEDRVAMYANLLRFAVEAETNRGIVRN